MKIQRRMLRQKPLSRITVKPALRQFGIFGSAAIMLLVAGWFVYFNQPKNSYGAVSGDYRSTGSGNWSTNATWEKYNGSSWAAATSPPNNTHNVITIRTGHTVTVTANATVDQVVIATGGQVTLNSGITLTLNNGTGTDLDVTGTFKNSGTVTISASATIAYQSGGKYQHNFSASGGTIPAATWNTGSTCEVIACTATPAGLNQTFYHFSWSVPSQNSDIDLAGAFTSINGNLTVTATGSKELRVNKSNGASLTINGDLVLTGGFFKLSEKSNGINTLTINGNYNQSGGTFEVVKASNSTTTITLNGNWSHTGGTLTMDGSSAVTQFIFDKAGTQTFTASGNTVSASSGNINFTVNSGSILALGTNILKGNNFTLLSGGELQMGSTAGITSSGSTGNIQVNGTRTYNTGAHYTYNGTAAQVTGNGLPATVNNLTLNNSTGLTLTNTVVVSNVLTLTSGKLTVGLLKEIQVTNPSTSSITGHSASSYVVGLLRRTVAGTGSYDFPLGTTANYELARVALFGATGFTTLAGSFTNSSPVTVLSQLVGLVVNALSVSSILDYGYWTLTPNSAMTGGTYDITLQERGHTQPVASASYCVVKRANSLSAWQSVGTHNYALQSCSGGVVTSVRNGLTSFSDFAIGYGEFLSWKNPVLISGVDGQVGAIYKFELVSSNVDTWVEIVSLVGGATLDDIDHFTDGYDEAWQPYITAAPNTTSSIIWRITYKIWGTSTDTVIPYLALTAIDVDGNSSNLKEFVEATNIYSYSVDAATDLTITYGTKGYRATSTVANVANIDTSFHEAMFQINHRNVSSFMYETGAVSTSGSTSVRQNSLYFKYFMPGNIALPIKLVSFDAKAANKEVSLKWVTAAENNNDYFTIERSADGDNFEKVVKQKGAGNSNITRTYTAVDKYPLNGVSYYRLKQTDYNGKFSYSEVKTVKSNSSSSDETSIEIKSVSPSVFSDNFNINFTAAASGSATFVLTSINGQVITEEKLQVEQGFNSYSFIDQYNMKPGIYFVILLYNDKKVSYKVVKQ